MDLDELITRVAARNSELQRDDAELGVKAIIKAIATAIAAGGRVEIRGFGSFVANYKAPRIAKNPRNGEKVSVPAKHVPGFKAGKELRRRVNGGSAQKTGAKRRDC